MPSGGAGTQSASSSRGSERVTNNEKLLKGLCRMMRDNERKLLKERKTAYGA